MRFPRAPVIVFILLFLVLPKAACCQEGGARATVDGLHLALVEAMKEAKTLGYNGRYRRLQPVVENSFDLPFIARVSVGRHWSGLDDAQKKRFIDTFRELSFATYASRFDDYSGERFEFVSEKDLGKGRVLVRTDLVKSDGEILHFDYMLHEAEDGWKIINVIVDGVSDLSLKRAQYTEIVKDDGFEALIRKINEKIREYETGNG